MIRTLPVFLSAILVIALPVRAQEKSEAVEPDAALREAFAGWEAKYKAFTEASIAARNRGQLPKGGVPPTNVEAASRAANAARVRIVETFGDRDDLGAPSYLLLASMHERSRDYASAVRAYELSLRKGDPDAPNLRTLGSLCIAAMNSKDGAVAAKWMRTLIDQEDRRQAAGRRNLPVRTSYYPRTLIALGEWTRLEQHLAALAKDSAPASRAAAATFGVVVNIERGDLKAARSKVAAIRAAPGQYPDHQAWAVLAELALCVHEGRFDEGARIVREFLDAPQPPDGGASAVDKNHRRYLNAVAPFLGKRAPTLRSDHCVGGDVVGADVLTGLRGKVVVLDFWQPWCEPCRKAMPEMVRAQTEYADELLMLGVCKVENFGYDVSERRAVRPLAAADYPAHVEDFRTDMALNYPLVICDTGANSTAYKIAGVPTLVIVDRQGIVRYMSCGAGEPGLFRLAVAGVVAAR